MTFSVKHASANKLPIHMFVKMYEHCTIEHNVSSNVDSDVLPRHNVSHILEKVNCNEARISVVESNVSRLENEVENINSSSTVLIDDIDKTKEYIELKLKEIEAEVYKNTDSKIETVVTDSNQNLYKHVHDIYKNMESMMLKFNDTVYENIAEKIDQLIHEKMNTMSVFNGNNYNNNNSIGNTENNHENTCANIESITSSNINSTVVEQHNNINIVNSNLNGCVGIGPNSMLNFNSKGSVALGYNTLMSGTSDYNIAFGYRSGEQSHYSNTIILNAMETPLISEGENRTYIRPIRFVESMQDSPEINVDNTRIVCYNTITCELISIPMQELTHSLLTDN